MRDSKTLQQLAHEHSLRLLCAFMVVCGFVLGWWGTSPHVMMGINWDNASYLASFASGQWTWGTKPWNSHYGIAQVYLLGSWIARACGGTFIDGFRLTNALFFAAGAGVFFAACLRLARSALIAAAATLVFATAWGNLILVFTLEDNILFMPAGVAILAICLARLQEWRPRDSMACGALAAFAALMSWQAAIYLGPPLYVAVLLGGKRAHQWLRARDAALIVLGFLLVLVGFAGMLALTGSELTFGRLLAHLFSRPDASFIPKDGAAAVGALSQWKVTGQHLGVGVFHEIGPVARDSAPLQRSATTIGIAVLAVEVLLVFATAWWSYRRRDWRLHLLAVVLLAFTVVTSLYHDLLTDKYKRYDYLPLVLTLLVTGGIGMWPAAARRWTQVAVCAALLAIVGVQSAAAVSWNRDWHRQMPPPPGYHGRDSVSWFGWYRDLRRRTPAACLYVVALSEVSNARYNHEITAALYTELPDYVVVAPSQRATAGWKKPLKLAAPVEAAQRVARTPCAWVSADASRLIDGARPTAAGGPSQAPVFRDP